MTPRVIMVAGLGFGDEGKGTTVEYLVAREKADLVVRYNGGPQAAHNVVRDDGVHHTFAQFGSGTFRGARTFLSRFMLVDPLALLNEGEHLESLGYDCFKGLYVDRECVLVTPYHRAANRIREIAREGNAHGSCGIGVGEAYVDAREHEGAVPLIGDLENPVMLKKKLTYLHDLKIEQIHALGLRINSKWSELQDLGLSPDFLVDRYQGFTDVVSVVDRDWLAPEMAKGTTIFEGAQGVLLDQDFGFQPHTTWSNTTWSNADELLLPFSGVVKRIGVTRSYTTRHGVGPFPTEWGIPNFESHNDSENFQGRFRNGHLDLVLMRYAIEVLGSLDEIALTHVDLAGDAFNIVDSYTLHGTDLEFFEDKWGDEIKVNRPADYDYQCRLTEALNRIKPGSVRLLDGQRDKLAWSISRRVGIPINITSYGPKLCHKRPHL